MSTSTPAPQIAPSGWQAGQAALGLEVALGTMAVQVWAEIGAETVRFVTARLEQDIKTQQAMFACTSLAELQKIQSAFFATAREHYAAEAVRMLEVLLAVATSGQTAATRARRYDDVPL